MIVKTITPFTLLMMLCSFGSQAQNELYIDGAQLYAKPSAIIHIEGELQNKSGSSLKSDGVIELTGNLTNDASAIFTPGTDNTSTERAIKFIGSYTQIINGNFSDTTNRYLYNLIIDKQTSSSSVQLFTNAYVKGSLVFGSSTTGANTYSPTATSIMTDNSNKGIIKTFDTLNNDYELYILNPSVNALKGYAALVINAAPADAYVMSRGAQGVSGGGLARNVSQTNVAYVFPLATSLNGYNAAGITFNSIGAGIDKVRGMFVDATGGVGSLSAYCSGCGTVPAGLGFNYYFPVDSCNGNQPQWVNLNKLPKDHGYWNYTGNPADVYSVEMYPNSFSAFGGATGNMWRVVKQAGSAGSVPSGDWTAEVLANISRTNDVLKYTTNTGCYAGAGVPGGQYTGFGNFQMMRSNAGIGLPVELVSLTASPIENKYIQVKWVTASETDNKGFEILRSIDGIVFQKIGWADANGNGNSTSESDYIYDDETVLPNVVYYYKLRQIDNDGKYKETFLVQAQISISDLINVSGFFPNPTNAKTSIRISTTSDTKFTLEIYDMLGQLLDRSEINTTSGNSLFELNTSRLAAGNYKAVIKSSNNIFNNNLSIIR